MPKTHEVVHYEVHTDHYCRFLAERPSAEAAVRYARWHAQRRPGRALRVVEIRTGRNVDIAAVRSDALGRIWTDVMPAGQELL